MKKILFSVSLFVCVFLFSIFIYSCTLAGVDNSMLGEWQITSSPNDSSLIESEGSITFTQDDRFSMSEDLSTVILPVTLTKTSCKGRIIKVDTFGKKITFQTDEEDDLDISGIWDFVYTSSTLTLKNSDETYEFER